MKVLVVGDVHATIDGIPECKKLTDYIVECAIKSKVDFVVYTGDIYNYHNIVHLPVVNFWKRSFKKIKEAGFAVISLVGNHDMANMKDQNSTNAVSIHENDIVVVSKPTSVNNVLFVPYYVDGDTFLRDIALFGPQKTIICHQTFDGSHYDNGFYAKDGLDSTKIQAERIISGHIHTPQAFANVWYIGSPRWRTLSDANCDRSIWVLDFDASGNLLNKEGFDTQKVCRPIFSRIDTPDMPADISQSGLYIVDVHGPVSYVSKRAIELQKLGVRVRTFPIETHTKIKESEGIAVAFNKYFDGFTSKKGTSKEMLNQLVKERVSWLR